MNYYYYYYYYRFMALWIFSGTTWVSWHQKGKTRKVNIPICCLQCFGTVGWAAGRASGL